MPKTPSSFDDSSPKTLVAVENPNFTAIQQQVQRIHGAVNDGTLDRATVNDALGQIVALSRGTSETAAAPRDNPRRSTPPNDEPQG